MPYLFEIAKTGENEYVVRLGKPGYEPGDPDFHYVLTIDAERVENINLKDYEWENRTVEDGKLIIRGDTTKLGRDRVRIIGPTSVRCQVQKDRPGAKYFDATFVDETVAEPERETLATMQKDYTWYPSIWHRPYVKEATAVVGVAVATGIVGKWLGWW